MEAGLLRRAWSRGCRAHNVRSLYSSHCLAAALSGWRRDFSAFTGFWAARAADLDTQVLSFGDGSSGALGHQVGGFSSDAFEPTPVQGLPNNIVKVAAGHYHSLAVTRDGEVWAWGRNFENQLGRLTTAREDWHRPQKVDGLDDVEVKDVVGSGVVSMAIGRDGSLWSWGSSKRGQLGVSPGLMESVLPQRVTALSDREVSQVALGWGHSLACTKDGELYAWGYGEDGRLGFLVDKGDKICRDSSRGGASILDLDSQEILDKEKQATFVWEPVRVEALAHEKIQTVACGLDHSLALTSDGGLYSFGDNSLGQLGREVSVQNTVEMVSYPGKNIHGVRIAAGLGHSLAIADASSRVELYSWGWNSASQLGRSGSHVAPALVEGLIDENLVDVKAGRVHSMALTADAKFWVWGSGRNGRLGLGNSADEEDPVQIENTGSVVQIACGFDHSLLLVRC